MSKKFNRKVVAMIMATSLAATMVPTHATQIIQEQQDQPIYTEELTKVTTGSAIQVTTGGAIQIKPVIEIEGNIVTNTDFETTTTQMDGNWGGELYAQGWKASAWGGSYTMPEVMLDQEEKVSGQYAVKFESTQGNARGWVEQSIQVEPNTTYILEVDLKSEKVNGSRFGVQVLEYIGSSTTAISTDVNSTVRVLVGAETQDWEHYRVEFTTGENTTRISLRPYFGTHVAINQGGKGWIDNLSIVKKPEVKVEGITLPEKARVAIGETITLKPVFAPEDATNKKVSWQSADESIATVSESGMVRGISEGTTYIKAISEDGDYEALCEVTVEIGGAINQLPNGSFEETIKVTNATQKQYWKDEVAPTNWNNIWVPTAGAGLQLAVDQTEFTHGIQSVHIKAPKQSRITFNTSVAIDQGKAYRLSMNIKTQDIVGTGAYFRVQYLDANGNKTQDAVPGISGIKGTKDWSDYELILSDIPENTTTVKIEVFFENATGEAWFDDAKLVETYEFSLSESTAKLYVGDQIQLEPIFGADIPNKKLEWTSSNEAVASVDEMGNITAKATGAATITATTIDGNKASCSISVEDPALIPVYNQLRQEWSDRLTLNNLEDKNNLDYQEGMKKLEIDAKEVWETMNKYDSASGEPDNRVELWSKFNSGVVSADLTSTISNLYTMTKAYASEGCSLYQNEELGKDIIAALDWFYAKRYNENVKMYNNWWDWDIGVPQRLNNVLVLMYDDLTTEQLDNHLRAINRFVPTPSQVPGGPNPLISANLLDTALVSAVSGILEQSNRRISEARDAISEVLPYVTKGNGFYEDGSYIDHTVFPYAGGYGGSLMSSLANLLFITDGTPWEVTDPLLVNVFDWIINAFEPLFYKGAMMDMVSGRGISRYNSSDHDKGRGLLLRMLDLSQTAPEPKKTQILSFIKENVLADNACGEAFFEKLNVNDRVPLRALLEDESITARGDLVLSKVYGAMDRTVHHRPGFSLGISMFSSRIGAFEVGNGENKKAWHTADGMMYLYNDDYDQFTKDFWPTVDPMRLPGITTDHSERTNKDWNSNVSSKDWVGGSTIHDLYSATGMDFEMEPGKSTLTGKKSWFMFDDEIVALGADITATDNRMVETIVENRKIKDSGDNALVVDGENILDTFGTAHLQNVKWALLGGNTEAGTDTIGYYFPEGSDVKFMRETRTGSWQDINDGGPDTPINKNYVSLAVEHGNNPNNAEYSYVLLPNKSAEEVAQYSEQADIEILANTSEVQAVRENNLGVTGMNFWKAGTVDYVTALNPSSIMIEKGIGTIDIGISDPTHKSKEVKVILDKEDYKVASKDNTVSVKDLGTQIEITVNTDKSMGKTHKLQLISTKPVQITLDQHTLSLRKGTSATLKVNVLPESAVSEELIWTSSDERVATVTELEDGTAIVKANKKGEAEIRVSTVDGRLSAVCRVTVRNNDNGQADKK